MAEYPKREAYFAHKLVRMLIRTCAAQEIGANGFMLVTVIAHTEDAKRYTAPVTFWNGQLMSVLGWNSVCVLERARKKAVEAGWLHYDHGGKGKVGKYWTMIPDQYRDIPDTPTDCEFGHTFFPSQPLSDPAYITQRAPIVCKNDQDTRRQRVENEETTSRERVENEETTSRERVENEETTSRERVAFIPVPIPEPIPKKTSPTEMFASSDDNIGENAIELLAEVSTEDTPPPALTDYVFQLDGGVPWSLPQSDFDKYVARYQYLDVPMILRQIQTWTEDNASQRKVGAKGMRSCITRWLNKDQNRGCNRKPEFMLRPAKVTAPADRICTEEDLATYTP